MFAKKIVYRVIVVVTHLILFSACNYNNRELYNESKKIPNINLHKVDYIFIVPNEGCGGCISYLENFYQNNNDNDNMYFIFTQIVSLKHMKNKININYDNTYLDEENKFIKLMPEDMKLYPCLLTIVNGKIKKKEFQKPGNNVLEKI